MDSDISERLLSLDIFRGVTIAAMIVVNNLTSWTDTTRFLRLTHAEWHGCNFADLIFPCFIFIVGVSSVFSFEKRGRTQSLPRLYRHILAPYGALIRPGPGDGQRLPGRLAVSGHLPAGSD